MPTEAGLSLFGVLKQADPALVDPGVTAQLKCLLDDVVVGKQEMVGAIDAVCNVAERIIGKLKEGGAAGGPPLLGAAVGNGPGAFPPTPAMKRFADSLARQKDIKPPPCYKTSISICRKFLSEHAPKKAEGETPGKLDSKPVGPAQMLYAKKIAQGKGVVIPEEAKANSAAMSAWIDSNRSVKRRKRGRKTAYKPAGSVAPQSATTTIGNANRMPLPLHRLPRSQIRLRVRRCGFLMATRRSLGSLAPAIARVDGMPHPGLIFLHSESADGCNARRAAAPPLAPI